MGAGRAGVAPGSAEPIRAHWAPRLPRSVVVNRRRRVLRLGSLGGATSRDGPDDCAGHGQIVRGVEQIPWLYEIFCSLYEWSGLGEWRRALVAGARGTVLDLGSGTGRNLPLLPDGTTAVALDPSLDALRQARRRAPAVPLVVGRAEALPFRAATFDTVLSGLVFCSVGDPRRGLEEVKRVLRPHGELRMLEHIRSRIPWRARVQDLIQPVWTWVAGGCHPNRDTEGAVEAAGFRIEPRGRRTEGTNRLFAARERSGLS